MKPGGDLGFHQELATDQYLFSTHPVSAQVLLEPILAQRSYMTLASQCGSCQPLLQGFSKV